MFIRWLDRVLKWCFKRSGMKSAATSHLEKREFLNAAMHEGCAVHIEIDTYEVWNFNKRTSIFGCNIQCLTNNCESWIHQLPKWEITNHPFWSTSLVWLSCYSWSPFWWLELAFKKGTRVGLMLESKSFNEFWSGTWVVCGGRQRLGVWDDIRVNF